jgi:hypothetical protein
MHAKQQTGWGWVFLWAGWAEAPSVAWEHALHYHAASTHGVADVLRGVRRRAWPVTYDVYPLALVSATLVGVGGGALLLVALLVMAAFKCVFVGARLAGNLAAGHELWLRTPAMSALWAALLLCGPPLAVGGLFPAAVAWGMYSALRAGGAVLEAHGDPAPGLGVLWAALLSAHEESARYIMRHDVPYVDDPEARRVSPLWAVAGLLPALAAAVLTPFFMLLPAALNVVPVLAAGWALCMEGLFGPEAGAREGLVPLFAVGALLAPALALAACAAAYVGAVVDGVVNAVFVTHANRSLELGFAYVFGNVYKWEYRLHKFALARHAGETVHWASFFPHQWALWAQPYMASSEWDLAGAPRIPVGVVFKASRFVPPGLRRPRLDPATGRPVDMCGPAYDVPGMGITRVGPGGVPAGVLPHAPPPGGALPPPRDEEESVVHAEQALRAKYGAAWLPAAYGEWAGQLRAGGGAGDAGAGVAGADGPVAGAGPRRDSAGVTAALASRAAAAAAAASAAAEAAAAEAAHAAPAPPGAVTVRVVGDGGKTPPQQQAPLPFLTRYKSTSPLAHMASLGAAAAAPLPAPEATSSCCLCCMREGEHDYEDDGVPGAGAGAPTGSAKGPAEDDSDRVLFPPAGAGAGAGASAGVGLPPPHPPLARAPSTGVKGPRGEVLLDAVTLGAARAAAAARAAKLATRSAPGSPQAAKGGDGGAAAASGSSTDAGSGSGEERGPAAAASAAAAAAAAGAAAAASNAPLRPAPLDGAQSAAAAAALIGDAHADALAAAAAVLVAGAAATSAAAAARGARAAAAAASVGGAGSPPPASPGGVAIRLVGGAAAAAGDDDEEDVFVLQPVVRPDLPDEWVAVREGVCSRRLLSPRPTRARKISPPAPLPPYAPTHARTRRCPPGTTMSTTS